MWKGHQLARLPPVIALPRRFFFIVRRGVPAASTHFLPRYAAAETSLRGSDSHTLALSPHAVSRSHARCSSCGQYLFLACDGSSVFHTISFDDYAGTDGRVHRSDSVARHEEVVEGGDSVGYGGDIDSLSVDPTGNRLVVTFRDTPSLLALFSLSYEPMLAIDPVAILRLPETVGSPRGLAWSGRCPFGATLWVTGSSGFVWPIPLIFGTLQDRSLSSSRRSAAVSSAATPATARATPSAPRFSMPTRDRPRKPLPPAQGSTPFLFSPSGLRNRSAIHQQ
eukprot:CAMPEP_0170737966 /NCGR_PEP_ID=MMETSP0437-20130122/4405_1 /TAXON_ID=0 /ORGANISM="Sexangularia sp." /LENGTH=279 /DNA_ID=CAMNT_0011076381 /DNA_START=114 /DNA_END=954 /DNA_ORIENTATION=+